MGSVSKYACVKSGAELRFVHVVGVFGAGEIEELWAAEVGRRSEVVHERGCRAHPRGSARGSRLLPMKPAPPVTMITSDLLAR